MCYTAIPGQNQGIRGAFFEAVPKPESAAAAVPKKKANVKRSCRYYQMVPVASGERWPMSVGWIPYAYRRRDRQTSHEKGKRLAKRLHKPNWRNYEKF